MKLQEAPLLLKKGGRKEKTLSFLLLKLLLLLLLLLLLPPPRQQDAIDGMDNAVAGLDVRVDDARLEVDDDDLPLFTVLAHLDAPSLRAPPRTLWLGPTMSKVMLWPAKAVGTDSWFLIWLAWMLPGTTW